MKILFVSRKSSQGIGGLSRFYATLSSHFSQSFFKSDLIHLCDATLLPLGVLLKLIFRKPLTVTVHGLDIIYPNKIYQTMLKVLLPKVDAVILDSRPTRPLLDKFHLKKETIFVINPGISLVHLRPSEKVALPALDKKIVLLTVGNLVLRKGHVWFLKNVFPKLSSNFVYIIVGEGPQNKLIQHTIKYLNLESKVFILGRITNLQLAFVFKKADIYVCPNQRTGGDFEGFGIACGEAAAMGLPVVASNVDGIPDIIKDGKNGLLVDPTPQAFIKPINELKDPFLRKKLGTEAKIYTKNHYNWQKTATEYIKVFESLI